VFDPQARPIVLEGWDFYPDRVTDCGGGKFKFSNSSYIIETEVAK